jgi:hypothetical protein
VKVDDGLVGEAFKAMNLKALKKLHVDFLGTIWVS